MNKEEFPRRGDVYWVFLDQAIGSELQKTRPAIIVSNNAANEISTRIIVAPITSAITRIYPFETPVTIQGRKGKALLDQIRSLDKRRLSNKIASLDDSTMEQVDIALKIALELR